MTIATIRRATLDDAARLSELGATIFVQSYQYPCDQGDMDAYLDETFSKEKIIKEINSETIYYYVAEMKPSKLPASQYGASRKGFPGPPQCCQQRAGAGIPEDVAALSKGEVCAEASNSIIGFVKFYTYRWTPRFKGKITFEVERLYIQKEMEGKNIGSQLMTTALNEAKQKNYKIIWLSVWENNERGIRFHQQYGFIIIGDGMFKLGKTEQKYLIMQQQ